MTKNQGLSIGVMAKAAVSGYAKTRLIPLLGAEGAAALQAALTQSTLQLACTAAPGRVSLFGIGPVSASYWAECGRRHGAKLAQQQGADLGERMHRALDVLLKQGPRALLIGTDCPELTARHLLDAGDALASCRMVFLPARDGGYVLVGSAGLCPQAFRDIAWGSAEVMHQTRAALSRLGWSRGVDWQEHETLADVDRPEDYLRAVAAGLIAALPESPEVPLRG